VLSDVASFSLGFENVDGFMNTVIKRNTSIPIETRFITFLDNQANMLIKVFEGEHAMTKDNVGLIEDCFPCVTNDYSYNFRIW